MTNTTVVVFSTSTTAPNGPTTVFETTTSYSTFTPPGSTSATSTPLIITTPSTTIEPSTSTFTQGNVITSVVTYTPSNDGTPTVVVLTSIESNLPTPPAQTVGSTITSSAASTTSSTAAALPTSQTLVSSSGLSAGSKIAVAVVVPVVAVALLVLAGLFFWRRQKQRREDEELRKQEIDDYSFNPNDNPTLPAVIGGASSPGEEPSEMREATGAGYRGWGTTPNTRKASTTLSGGNGAAVMARSDSGSNPSPYQPGSPTTATAHSSDVQSGDPLVGRPTSTDSETIGALGVAPAVSGNRQDRGIHRGPSNASSAYSGANRSDISGDAPLPQTMSSPQYYGEAISYDEAIPPNGPYGNAAYETAQPVIRDVQARRNTRIENPSVFPQQGNSGIAQNF